VESGHRAHRERARRRDRHRDEPAVGRDVAREQPPARAPAAGTLKGYGGDSLVLTVVPVPAPAALFALAAVTGARRRRR
ncbi:MAG: hypothetical protein ACKOJI_09600, partial [Phycisphaerales bacterium]